MLKNDGELYLFDGKKLVIKDDACDLALEEDFSPARLPANPKDGKVVQKKHTIKVFAREGWPTEFFLETEGMRDGEYKLIDENGSVKAIMFYKLGKLHGPSFCYSKEGTLSAEAWFWEGKQEGKCVWYYLDGAVYAKQRYRNGLLEGQQEFYYPDQSPKTVMHYRKGRLHGEVFVYGKDGAIERSLIFSSGKIKKVV
jgi:antitoxin component YwqK of YwqJK toxin-antitoxin module